MTANQKPMQRLYRKLRSVGYSKPYVQSLLPNWWDDAIADNQAGFQQASLLLARLFSIQPESLWTDTAPPDLVLPDGHKFKHRANTQPQDLGIACALARSAARLALKSFEPEFKPEFYTDAAVLREQLLMDKRWIGFQDLLAYCLQLGIPVIFLDYLPARCKKMAGVAFEQEGRPAIVLTQRKPYGHLLFDLAHELGHITLGHTQGGRWVIDATIDDNAEGEDEKAANRFALELITGNPECKIVPTGRNLSPSQLANAAMRYGEAHQIDPLHIALNYGHSTRQWGVAIEALKLIAQDAASDQQILVSSLLGMLESGGTMPVDDMAALKRLMGEVDA